MGALERSSFGCALGGNRIDGSVTVLSAYLNYYFGFIFLLDSSLSCNLKWLSRASFPLLSLGRGTHETA
jgi:hypothetical protein